MTFAFRPTARIGTLAALAALMIYPAATQADPGTLTVQVNKPGVKISPVFYGLMTEEINHAFDGGLYAELIQNRAFLDDDKAPAHWALIQDGGGTGTMTLDNDNPVPGTTLTRCLRLDVTKSGTRVGVANTGFWGIPVRANAPLRVSFWAKATAGTGPLTVDVESSDGKVAQGPRRSVTLTPAWKKYQFTLAQAYGTGADNRFVLAVNAPGTVWLTQVSAMPPTFNNRPNGTRIDLMQKLGEMQPAFLRMPGGNYLEGNTLAGRFNWKNTIGPVDGRLGNPGTWGYRSSDGFGLLEMLEWCQDLKMETVLAVHAGYALNREHVVAGPGLAPYVQDALDEIEYVTGGPNTTWGARRVADGHPAPFPLTYVEIGNEDTFDNSGSYAGRYAQFYDAIKAKYPKLQIIATAPVQGHVMDVLDDHYYRSAAEMARDATHYDSYDRKGPKIFVGEWASTEGSPTPTMQAALGDAAWLTGLERNSDLVVMEAYAPLLVNVNPGARQWGTNLIGYDALTSFGSPSYWVQSMFAHNTGTVTLPTTFTLADAPPVAPAPLPKGKIGVATWATQAEFKDISVTQDGKTLYSKDFASGDGDWTLGQGQWQATDGVLRQTSDAIDCRAEAGDTNWGDYTYSLKARKLSGKEGFLIQFHVQNDGTRVWWNVGGWGNTRSGLQTFHDGALREIGTTQTTVETGRWYDVRVEVTGYRIRCFLDGKLITEVTDTPPPPPSPVYAAASRDTKTGDILLKTVNMGAAPQSLQVSLSGLSGHLDGGTQQVLAGEPGDMNSVEAPDKVAPVSSPFTGTGSSFVADFPAHSVTVYRLKVKK